MNYRSFGSSVRFKLSLILSLFLTPGSAVAQQQRPQPPPASPGPMLKDGTVEYDTPDFTLVLVRSSQTVAALKPKGAQGFDFTPGDLLQERSQDGYHHLGDLELRIRTAGGEWKAYSTAVQRSPVTPLPLSASMLASADLTPTLPPELPLQIMRTWLVDSAGKLVLRFTIKNKSRWRWERLGFR